MKEFSYLNVHESFVNKVRKNHEYSCVKSELHSTVDVCLYVKDDNTFNWSDDIVLLNIERSE